MAFNQNRDFARALDVLRSEICARRFEYDVETAFGVALGGLSVLRALCGDETADASDASLRIDTKRMASNVIAELRREG